MIGPVGAHDLATALAQNSTLKVLSCVPGVMHCVQNSALVVFVRNIISSFFSFFFSALARCSLNMAASCSTTSVPPAPTSSPRRWRRTARSQGSSKSRVESIYSCAFSSLSPCPCLCCHDSRQPCENQDRLHGFPQACCGTGAQQHACRAQVNNTQLPNLAPTRCSVDLS